MLDLAATYQRAADQMAPGSPGAPHSAQTHQRGTARGSPRLARFHRWRDPLEQPFRQLGL